MASPYGMIPAPTSKRHAPAPAFQRRRAEHAGQHHADQAGDHHRTVRAHRLHRDIQAAAMQRRRLHQERRARPHLATQRKALQQAKRHDQDRRQHTDRCIRRRQRQADHRDAHQPERPQHRRLASAPVAIAADDQRAQRTGEETHAERGQRCQQAEARRVGRKKHMPDLRREERVGHEVVELDGIAGHHRRHLLQRQAGHAARAIMRPRHQRFPDRHDVPLRSAPCRSRIAVRTNRCPSPDGATRKERLSPPVEVSLIAFLVSGGHREYRCS